MNTINLIGSEISKELLSYPSLDSNIQLNSCVLNVTPWALFEDALNIPDEVINKLDCSEKEKQYVRYELNKTVLKEFEENNSDYFLIDLLSFSSPLYKIIYKNRMTYSQSEIINSKVLPLLANTLPSEDFKYSEVPQFRFPAEDVEEGLTALSKWLLENNEAQNIIVYCPKRATRYIRNDDDNIYTLSNDAHDTNKILDEVVFKSSQYLLSKIENGQLFMYERDLTAYASDINDFFSDSFNYINSDYIKLSHEFNELIDKSHNIKKEYIKTNLDGINVFLEDDGSLQNILGDNSPKSFSIKKSNKLPFKKRIKKISILGSGCSRNLFNYEPLKSAFKVVKYGNQLNPWGLFDESLDLSDEIINQLDISDFKKKMVGYELNKTAVYEYEKTKSDYFMIDLMSISFSLYKITINNKTTYTHNRNIGSKVLPQLEALSKFDNISCSRLEFWHFPSQMIEDGIEAFCNWLKDLYPPEKIIVYLPKRAEKYISSSDGLIHSYSQSDQDVYTVLDEIVKRSTAYIISRLGHVLFYECPDDLIAYNENLQFEKPYPYKYTESIYKSQANDLFNLIRKIDNELITLDDIKKATSDNNNSDSELIANANSLIDELNNDKDIVGSSVNISQRTTTQRIIIIILLIIVILIAISSFFKK